MVKRFIAVSVAVASALFLVLAVFATPARADTTVWSENWDSYAVGTNVADVSGWKPWNNLPSSRGGITVSNAQAHSGSNSLSVYAPVDLGRVVHEFSGCDSGKWVFTYWQYVPSDFTQSTQSPDIDLYSVYSDSGPTSWSSDLYPNPNDDRFYGDTPSASAQLSIVTDRWVEVRVEIDLDNDTQKAYYDGNLLYEDDWAHSGTTAFAAFDLWALRAASVYFDDFSLVRVEDEQPAPRVEKQAALGELQALLPTLTNRAQRSLVSSAIAGLNRTLTPSYWLDDSHLRERGGLAVFAGESTAVSCMQSAVKRGLSPGSVDEPIAALVNADKLLASVAIGEAKDAGGKASLISLAEKWLARGDGYAAAGKPQNAINAYACAWGYAVSAY
jgi:hypothetical protein